jgi:hypothetical protein
MRRRLRALNARPMARRPMRRRTQQLVFTPRARGLAGWLAALLLVLAVAAAARILGGDADGSGVADHASPSATAPLTITFGTALDERRLVPDDARATRFARGDTFAYSVNDADPASAIYVEVRRVGGGPIETVQAPVDEQLIPGAPARIGFTVPAAALLDVFGGGTFEMLIFLDPAGEPIAVGRFELIETVASASATP